MSISENKLVKKTAVFLAFINVLAFFVYYTALYVFRNQVTPYVSFYFNEIVSSLLPILAATSLFITHVKRGVNKSLLHALAYSLTWILNLFPYYAFEYAYEGLDIEAVLTFTTIHTLFMVFVVYIEITVLFLLMIFVTKKIAKRRYGSFDKNIILKKSSPWDFGNPVTAGIFSSSAAMFVYNLVFEIIDTVSYVRNFWGSYQTGEIIYIVFRYLFLLAMLFVSHFVANYAKKKLLNH